MGQFDNLNDSDFRRVVMERLDKLERAAPMNNAAIGRGGIEVYDGGVIMITNGGLQVTGTAEIIGALIASGTITFTGEVDISGPLTISGATDITGDTTMTGNLDVNGPMSTTGTLDVEGVTNLKNDLNVVGDGMIVAGQTTVRPSGVINLGDAFLISQDGIKSGFAQYIISPVGTGAWHQFTGGGYFQGELSAMTLQIDNMPTTSQPANVYIDPVTGEFRRSTA